MFQPNKIIKSFAFIFGVITLSFSLSYAVLAVWQEPALIPPDGNTDAPLNVGINGQIKRGSLGLNFGNDGIIGGAPNGLIIYQGNVGIGTANPEFKLSIDNDGGIIAKGAIGAGANLIAAGSGARMIWYPKKGAFRAGTAKNTDWDDANIGLYSIALGVSSKASGIGSFAYGPSAVAGGNYSTATGMAATAFGDYSYSIGTDTDSFGPYSFAMGTAINTSATANNSFGIGLDNMLSTITQPNTMAIMGGNVGIGTTNPEFKLSLDNDGGIISKGTFGSGADLLAAGAGTRMVWYPKKAAFRAGGLEVSSGTQWDNARIGNYSAAFGKNSEAAGEGGFAAGVGVYATGAKSIALGAGNEKASGIFTEARGNNSVAIGTNAHAEGLNSVAIGTAVVAGGQNSMALGQAIEVAGSNSIGIGIGLSVPVTVTANGVMAIMGGKVGIGTVDPSSRLEVDGGIRLNTINIKPVCNDTQRGVLWFTQGVINFKDSLEVCAKDNVNVYAWRILY